MSSAPEKGPKKEKEKRQTAEERQEALRYNQMMYGRTAGERLQPAKKTNLGTAYLQHPKFQELMAAFRKGTSSHFEVRDKGKLYTINTDGTQICFDGRVIYYSRPLNRFEDNLLMDRAALIQYQTIDSLVHFAAAVLRSLPELQAPALDFVNREFTYDGEPLGNRIALEGPNLLVGAFKHTRSTGKPKAW